jgi:hypothetical protein
MTNKFKNWLFKFLTNEDLNKLHSLVETTRGIESKLRSKKLELEDNIEEQQNKYDRFKYHIEHYCGAPFLCIGQSCGLIIGDRASCDMVCKGIRRKLLDSFYDKERRRERGKYTIEEGEDDE